MNYPLLTLALSILALSAILAANGNLRRIRAWFTALPAKTRADIVTIIVGLVVLVAWGVS